MKQRIWLITGISSGLGKALAQSVMESGEVVIGTFRTQKQVEHFNKKNQNKGYAIQLDISDLNKIEKAVESVISKYGRIDVLLNNAGVGFVGAIEETSIQEIQYVFDVNFYGTLKMTQAVLPYMRKARQGHIVQISSHGGIKAFAGFGIYNASKFALEGFSEALAQEIEPLGIKLSLIEPGPFRTNFAGNGLGEANESIEDYSQSAGIFRKKLKSVDGKQEGDPEKASKAIINLVNSEQPRLRMPLGKVALMTIGMKLESINNDLEASRAIAESVVY